MEGEENVWRNRIGSYHIRHEMKTENRVIYVFKAERRTSKTY
jgi:mRNA-degrading endonuclease RelE of RelBE toxin-antitoxin system